MHNHYYHTFVFSTLSVCQCQKQTDCRNQTKCDGCNCIHRELTKLKKIILNLNFIHFIEYDPIIVDACDHCPSGTRCDASTGACIKGTLKLKSFTLKFINLIKYL